MADTVSIASDHLRATIALRGAELQSLTDADGRELMTNADPAYWSGRAPLLFPIVGRLNNDILRHDGKSYRMEKHGFARKSDFTLVEAKASEARFLLTDSAETRAQYPFPFSLEAHFRLEGAQLFQTITVHNTGSSALPFSFGFHPAFAWPLPYGAAKETHQIRLEVPEPAPLAILTEDGLVAPFTVSTPVRDRTIALADPLFAHDALIWPTLSSQSLAYGPPAGPELEIVFPDTSSLGIWTKPGAAFVCIEPWAGFADPAGYLGEFVDKPGIRSLPSGASTIFRMNVQLQIQD